MTNFQTALLHGHAVPGVLRTLDSGQFIDVNGGGSSDRDITEFRAVFIDLDIHKGDPVPTTWHLPPHVINTRHTSAGELAGMHAYWMLAPGATREQWQGAQNWVIDHYRSDPVCKNPSRIMRLPNTPYKDPTEPCYVEAAIRDGVRYQVTELPAMAPRHATVTDSGPGQVFDDPATMARAVSYLQTVAPAVEGESGDQHTFNVAARCRDLGLPAQVTYDLMAEHFNERCEPPWAGDELAEKVNNAYRFAKSAQGNANPLGMFGPVEGGAPPVVMGYDKQNQPQNAELFLQRHYPDGRLVVVNEVLYAYTGRVWSAVDEADIAAVFQAELHVAGASDSFQNGCVKQVIKMARRAGTGIQPTQGVIIYNNGIVDLKTMQLGPHSQAVFSTILLPYDYLPGAQCPAWLRFLDEIFDGDAQRIALVQEWFGYMLSGSYDHQKAMLWLGRSRSGKGTLARVLRALVGAENYSGLTLDALTNDAHLETVIGVPVLFIGDAHSIAGPGRTAVLERFKSITGGDAIPVNRKYKRPWNGVLPGRITISANSMLSFLDDSGAAAGRFLVVPFNNTWMGREDLTLSDRLVTEIEGICQWSVVGLQRLRAAGRFTDPAASVAERDEMRERYSPLQQFATDCLTIRPGGRVFTTDAWGLYQKWCAMHNFRVMTRPGWVAAMRATFRGQIEKHAVQIGGRRAQGFTGVEINADAELAQSAIIGAIR